MPGMERMERIEAAIQTCEDRKVLRVLNLAWLREYFRLKDPKDLQELKGKHAQ